MFCLAQNHAKRPKTMQTLDSTSCLPNNQHTQTKEAPVLETKYQNISLKIVQKVGKVIKV